MFFGRTDAEAEAPVLWSFDAKNWRFRKDPVAGKDWRQEKRATDDELVKKHHQLSGFQFAQTLRDSEGQRKRACCGPWGLRVRHDWATEQWQQQILKKDLHTCNQIQPHSLINYCDICMPGSTASVEKNWSLSHKFYMCVCVCVYYIYDLAIALLWRLIVYSHKYLCVNVWTACKLSHIWLCNPKDCSPQDSSVHGIFEARILEWVTISPSRVSSQPRDQTHVSWTGRQAL